MRDDTLLKKIVDDIVSMKIHHRQFDSAVRHIELSLLVAFPGEVLTLVGPPRAGKTRAIFGATKASYPSMGNASSPVVYVEAENSSREGEFSSKAFMISCVDAIKHPLFGSKLADNEWLADRLYEGTESKLRDAFEAALVGCSKEIFVVDEAQHFEYIRGGIPAAVRMFESLKCLANKTQVKMVVAGSYKLLEIVCHSPHFLGRQHLIEFPRYRVETEGDIVEWMRILMAFSDVMAPYVTHAAMQSWARMLFEGSFGCIGQLSRWLRDAMALAALNDRQAIVKEDLIATRMPEAMAHSILGEIEWGERTMVEVRAEQKFAMARDKRTQRSSKPFQRNARRSPRGGRSLP